MAYVDITKDLSEIRSKSLLGLTRKQLIGFGAAAVIGVPVFLTTRAAVGNDVGLILMIGAMSLPLLYAIYEPKGMTVEQMAVAWLRFQFIAVGPRPYQNINLYDVLTAKEGSIAHATDKNTVPKKAGHKKGKSDRRPAQAGRGDRKKPPRKQGE